MTCSTADAAWTQTISQFFEVCRPIGLADRLQHFDRDDPIEGAAHIAIVLQTQITSVRRRSRSRSRRCAKANCSAESVTPGHGAVVPFHHPLGKAAPATADFEHPFSAGQIQQTEHAVEFGVLRLFQGLARSKKIVAAE